MPDEEISQVKLVRDLMTVGVPTCTAETPVIDLARMLLDEGWEAVVVLDGLEGHALGVISQDELINAYIYSKSGNQIAGEIMRDGVPQVPPDIPLAAAAQLMQDLKVRTLYLMHHAGGIEYPAAMISYKHILRHLAANNDAELRDLGIRAERQTPLQMFIQRRDAARNKNRNY